MRFTLRFSVAIWLLACAPQVVSRPVVTVSPSVTAPSQWEPDIAQFEAQDRASPPPLGSIVFVGSSSIRMWTTLDRDFPGVPVLNRGFGGSEAGDVAQFAERIVVPYKPPVVVFYAGDNDLAAGKTPAQVLASFKSFVAIMHRDLPRTHIVFVSIKPSLARWNIVDKMRAANQLVRDYVGTDDRLTYVDVFTPMLDASGQPRRELYLEDGLHMTPAGYAIWRALIAPVIK
ncbi:MAG TPA: SGNH/GDSL hydrolase family protein [Gemmatimonadaceae bacterium]|nr:SGNH/GDSL hydrolase family protein [Gemmatimonadaceae bacterium]